MAGQKDGFKGERSIVLPPMITEIECQDPLANSRISNRNNLFDEILMAMSDYENIESLRYASSLMHSYLASMRYLYQFRHTQKQVTIDPIEASIHYNSI